MDSLNPQVIFQDDAILVLNKPSGLTVNRSDTTRSVVTLQDYLESHAEFGIERGNQDHDFYKRSGIVHRLDKETSGVIIIAKNLAAFEDLQAQFKERIVKKSYVALAHGEMIPQTGEIRAPVGRLDWNRKRFGVIAGGREAISYYQTKAYYLLNKEILSLVSVFPQTGRTHQIRVHLKYLNHPIFSDELYVGRKTARLDRKLLNRLFLHAEQIKFQHPVSKQVISFKAPWAEDLIAFIKTLELISTTNAIDSDIINTY